METVAYGIDTTVLYYCRCDEFGDGRVAYDSVYEFLDMCEVEFGEAPDLTLCDDGGWYLGDTLVLEQVAS